ncbi:MAG: signal recognition particle-docking protein FtsY [Candidatus Micrarchaeia archaeon]|jgi:fused signal recognition particle receptor
MFGLLKDKLSGFVKKFTKKEEEKAEIEEPVQLKIEEKTKEEYKQEIQKPEIKQVEKPKEEKKEIIEEQKEKLEIKEELEEKREEIEQKPKEEEAKEEKPEIKILKEPKKIIKEKPKEIIKEPEQIIEKPKEIIRKPEGKQEERIKEIDLKEEIKTQEIKPKQDKKIKLSLESRLRGLISNKIKIKEKDINSLLDDLELSLLESDVNLDVAGALKEEIRNLLVDKEINKDNIEDEIKNAIKHALILIMNHENKFDLVDKIKSSPKPFKVLFIGPNGAGKTTTIAKVSKLLENNNLSCVLSASDTFRAAAIEQLGIHGERLGKKVIKGQYGADPASIAYDAVNHAKSHNLDAVLIDSAGRQETNKNLIDELRKIGRIIKPDLTIYIGESIAGHSVIDQIKEFNEAVKIDGVILTKLDCDAKGGNAISIPRATNIPVVYIGVGQSYEDLIVFQPDLIAEEIVG